MVRVVRAANQAFLSQLSIFTFYVCILCNNCIMNIEVLNVYLTYSSNEMYFTEIFDMFATRSCVHFVTKLCNPAHSD